MRPFFKSKIAIVLFLLIIGGIYGCKQAPKSGSSVNDSASSIDTAKMADHIKPASPVKLHDATKKTKPDTLVVAVVPTKADTLPHVTDTVKTGGKTPNPNISTNNIHHFLIKRLPVSATVKQTSQKFMLIKKEDIKTVLPHPLPPAITPAPVPTPAPLPAPAPVPLAPPVSKPQQLKFGILGYSYPKDIVVDQSKDIHAFISIVYPASKVKDTLLKISIADDPQDGKDSINIFEPIRLYKYVTLTLTPTDSSIKVINYPQVDARQQIDTLEGNKWVWSINATSADNPVSKLKLIISTEDPQNYEEKTIPIYIKVNPHFFRKIYDFLMDDPKVLVVSILIPLITFIGGLLFAKRKKRLKK